MSRPTPRRGFAGVFASLAAVVLLFPGVVLADSNIDLAGIKASFDESSDSAFAIGSAVVLFVALIVLIKIAIRIVKMADPLEESLKSARGSLDKDSKTHGSASGRYGQSYKRQAYENPVVDSLYSHAEFLEFSARLHEREAEYLAQQKAGVEGTADEDIFDQAIEEANAKITEFEAEQEQCRAQIEYYESMGSEFFDPSEGYEDGQEESSGEVVDEAGSENLGEEFYAKQGVLWDEIASCNVNSDALVEDVDTFSSEAASLREVISELDSWARNAESELDRDEALSKIEQMQGLVAQFEEAASLAGQRAEELRVLSRELEAEYAELQGSVA